MAVRARSNRTRPSLAACTGILLVSVVLPGCFFGGKPACDKRQEYQASGSVNSVQVPDGLDQPNRSTVLEIPDASPDAERRAKGDPCLETPPDYFERDGADPGVPD